MFFYNIFILLLFFSYLYSQNTDIIIEYLGRICVKKPEKEKHKKTMIVVTRLDGKTYWINPHQIESIECKPDVTICMLSGKYIVVKDSPEEIIGRIVEYRRQIGAFKNEE